MQTTDPPGAGDGTHRAAHARTPAGEAVPRLGAVVELPEPLSYRVKRRLLGKPLMTADLQHERLGKPTALAVFASDNLSSSAYATEEILHVLVPAIGLLAFSYVVPITVAMLVVLGFLILSYRQTIKEYPSAGGAYIVTKDNFGMRWAQVAGVALLTDYILTVAVSVAAGSAALASAFPALARWVVPISLAFIVLIAFGNLRGMKESGAVFAVPTYFFMVNMVILLAVGAYRTTVGGGLPVQPEVEGMVAFGEGGLAAVMMSFVVAHAFASGGAAVTGVEAISNGVPAFKPPEWKNARTTLVVMGTSLGVMFLGLSFLAAKVHAVPYEEGTPTVISQVGELVYGKSALGQVLFFALQAGTMLILVLAANTSYADFPRLAAFAAGDYFMPRQLTKRGHRLVYSNGVFMLSVTAAILVVATGAKVSSLIPLYAIGVFTSFTLSQSGMARHHVRLKEQGWKRGLVINTFGAFLSFVVLVIVAVTKFTEGAWKILIIVPVLILLLRRLNRQYQGEIGVLDEDAVEAAEAPILPKHTVLVLVDKISRSSARAIQYARTLTPDDLRAVHVALDPEAADALAEQWERLALARMPLEVVECPDRRIDRAVLELTAEVLADGETEVSVLVPRREYSRLWHRLLHDRTSDNIAKVVGQLPHANVTFVPFHFEDTSATRHVQDVVAGATAAAVAATPAGTDVADTGTAPAVDAGVGPGGLRRRRTGRKPATAGATDAAGITTVADVVWRNRATVRGHVHSLRVRPFRQTAYLECTIEDRSGRILVVFTGRRRVPGIAIGRKMTVEGTVGEHRGHLALLNPAYTLHPDT